MAIKGVITAREDAVTDMWVKGYSQRRIVRELEKPQYTDLRGKNGKVISQMAVCKIIKRVEARILATQQENVLAMKHKHTLALQHNIELLRDAYDQSTQAQVYQKEKTGNGAGKAFLQTEIGQKSLVGDHSILREIRETHADIRKIWGADAPMKTESVVTGAMQVAQQDLSKLSDDELQTLLALQQKLLADQTPNATPGPTSDTSDSAV